jgi:hypothetical protein
MYCESCGKELSLSFKFCNGCGIPITQKSIDSESNLQSLESKSVGLKLITENNIKTSELVIKTILSAGIYYWLYIWHLQKIIDNNCNSKLEQSKLLLIGICINGWASYFMQFGSKTAAFAGFLFLIGLGLIIYWNFKAKKIIEDYALYVVKTNLRLNAFYLFFLGEFYICYCINDLEDLKKRNDQIIALQSKS